MKKTAVLIFGTFNPVTKAHIRIGELAQKNTEDSDILYVPAKNSFLSSWKKMDCASIIDEKDRLRLLDEAVKEKGFMTLDIELNGTVSGKTYDTVRYVKDVLGYSNIVLCMGSDKLSELHKWYRAKDLIDECHFMIIERGSNMHADILLNESSPLLKDRKEKFFTVKNSLYTDISATKVRTACMVNDFASVKKMVPENVLVYLKNQKKLQSNLLERNTERS